MCKFITSDKQMNNNSINWRYGLFPNACCGESKPCDCGVVVPKCAKCSSGNYYRTYADSVLNKYLEKTNEGGYVQKNANYKAFLAEHGMNNKKMASGPETCNMASVWPDRCLCHGTGWANTGKNCMKMETKPGMYIPIPSFKPYCT